MKCFPDGKRITSVSSFGTGSFTAPQFHQDDTTVTMCTLDEGELVKVRVDCISNRPHKMNYYLLQGTNGAYEAPRGMDEQHKVHIMPEGAEYGYKQEWAPLKEYEGLYLPERYKTATEEQRNLAFGKIVALAEIAEIENATELLLEAKGFDGAVVSIVDKSVDVVINASAVTDGQIAQIEDIVARKTGIAPENIVITPIN
jgi:hypothetical protein